MEVAGAVGGIVGDAQRQLAGGYFFGTSADMSVVTASKKWPSSTILPAAPRTGHQPEPTGTKQVAERG